MNLQELLKEFLFDCQLRKLSERTIKSYRNINDALFHYTSSEYGFTEIEEVNHKVLQAYINYLTDTGSTPYILGYHPLSLNILVLNFINFL